MNNKIQISKYIIGDFLSSSLAWIIFNWVRKTCIESSVYGVPIHLQISNYLITSTLIISSFWIFIYWFVGFYHDVYRKSRLIDFYKTITSSVLGVVVIFFTLILDDIIVDYKTYYFSFGVLLILQITISFIPRNILITRIISKLRKGKIAFNTLLIGNSDEAIKFINNINNSACKFIGFVNVFNNLNEELSKKCRYLGNFDDIKKIIKTSDIDEVLIVLESEHNKELRKIIAELRNYNLIIKFSSNLYPNLIGETQFAMIYDIAVLQLKTFELRSWQHNFKLIFDKIASILFLIFFSPVFLATAIAVKLSSKGSIIYKQKRVGKNEKEFYIYKFRSMVQNAEQGQPQLSSTNDQRITKFGKFMRSTRLDEIPQFYNVLKGDMSIVGPRPERQFYIDKIVKHAPEYRQLLKTKPGITSLGQVKFGYAENIEEMLERLKFDILYMNNRSLYLDFKILILTILTILKSNGK